MKDHHEPRAAYAGPATVRAAEVEVTTYADLRGRFEPIDGRFHWYGRVASPGLDGIAPGTTVTVATAHGEASARLSDVDPWGRPRVSGLGTPPF